MRVNAVARCVLQIGGGRNSHEAVLKVAEMVIKESRVTRVQPFNEYRKKFNLKPYASFHELTGEMKKNNVCVNHFFNFYLYFE